MTDQYNRAKSNFEFGDVFSRGFAALGRHGLTLVGLGLILVLIPQVAGAWLVRQQGEMQGANWVSLIIGSTVGVVGRGALIHAAIAAMRSDRVSLGESLSAGIRLFGPVFGVSWLVGVGVGLASILLIIPGIFLAVAWSVAVPVRIDGKPGVTDAISKSHEMTRGHRWAIFAIWLIVWIIPLILLFAVAGAMGAMIGTQSPFYDLVVEPTWTLMATIITSVTSASIYMGLSGGRTAKVVADVFN